MYIIIIGSGQTGRRLAHEFSIANNVVVVDKNRHALEQLGERFNGMTVLGDALALATLEKAGIKEAESVVLTTGNDNMNLVVGKIAKEVYKVKNVVLQIYDEQKSELFKKEGLKIVNKTQLLVKVFSKSIF